MPNFDAGHVLTIHTKNIDLRDFLKKRRVGDVERASGRLKDGAARNVVTILTGSVQADDETYPALDTLKTDKALATCAYSFLEDAMGRAPKAFKVRYTADSNTITNICETILLELRSNLGPNVGYNAAQPKAAPAEQPQRCRLHRHPAGLDVHRPVGDTVRSRPGRLQDRRPRRHHRLVLGPRPPSVPDRLVPHGRRLCKAAGAK